MDQNPWITPVGTTPAMLRLVPGMTLTKMEAYQAAGAVELYQNNPGRGARIQRVAMDALQLKVFEELTALSVPLDAIRLVWLIARERAWFGVGAQGVAIYAGPEREIVVREYGADGPMQTPDAVVFYRVAPAVSRMAALIGITEVTP